MNTGTPKSKKERSIRLWSQLKKLVFGAENTAGKDFGEAEDWAGRPLLPISPYLSQVSPDLWRGSWPTIRALAELRNQGIKTMVNLCAERYQDPALWLPIIDNCAPRPDQVDEFLDTINRFGPVFVHCEAGVGRTGCMVAAYRVKRQGWTAEQALKEAESLGLFMPIQKDFIRNL